MGSADRLRTSFGLNLRKNRLKSLADMKQKPNSMVEDMTLNCDIDIESEQLSHRSCTPTH